MRRLRREYCRGGRPTKVSMIIEDDGVGFDVEAMSINRAVSESGGLGLHGMRERASLLKGDLEIESTKSGGTPLYVSIPSPKMLLRADLL